MSDLIETAIRQIEQNPGWLVEPTRHGTSTTGVVITGRDVWEIVGATRKIPKGDSIVELTCGGTNLLLTATEFVNFFIGAHIYQPSQKAPIPSTTLKHVPIEIIVRAT